MARKMRKRSSAARPETLPISGNEYGNSFIRIEDFPVVVVEPAALAAAERFDVDRFLAKIKLDVLRKCFQAPDGIRSASLLALIQPLNISPGAEAGGSFALFEAVATCAQARIAMPAWVAKAFIDAFGGVQMAEIDSWDKAFGRPWPKHKKVPAVRQRLQKGFFV